jgi:hypothetical protein
MGWWYIKTRHSKWSPPTSPRDQGGLMNSSSPLYCSAPACEMHRAVTDAKIQCLILAPSIKTRLHSAKRSAISGGRGGGLKRKRVGNLQNRNLRTLKFHIDIICYQDISSQWQLSSTDVGNGDEIVWTCMEPIYTVKALIHKRAV